jgi:hypothetical protein
MPVGRVHRLDFALGVPLGERLDLSGDVDVSQAIDGNPGDGVLAGGCQLAAPDEIPRRAKLHDERIMPVGARREIRRPRARVEVDRAFQAPADDTLPAESVVTTCTGAPPPPSRT